jgi:hypothetical protein
VPLSNRLSLLVIVWSTESLLVQVTLVPVVTRRVCGTKAKPEMFTVACSDEGVEVGVGV